MKILTLDLEYDFETNNLDNLKFIPKILDFFDEHNVKATFFVLGELVKKNEDLIKEINRKHEIACHSFSHKRLNKLNELELEEEIKKSKEAFKEIDINVKGFRAPYFITNKNLWNLLKKYDFVYDSSIAGFFPGRYYNFFKKKTYKINGIIELPIPNLVFPIQSSLSYYRLSYPFSKIFKIPYMFYFHPCEFLKEINSNEINFIVKSLYKRNLKKSWSIFEEVIKKEKWVSCKDFISSLPSKQSL